MAQTLEALRPRGDRGGSELCADVWGRGRADQDGSARRGGAGGGVPDGHVSARAPGVGGGNGSAAGAAGAQQLVRKRTQTDQSAAGAAAAGGLSPARRARAETRPRGAIDRLALPDGAARRRWRRCSRCSSTLRPTIAAERDARAEARRRRIRSSQRLMTAPGVGPIVALTFRAVLDTPTRFGGRARAGECVSRAGPDGRQFGRRATAKARSPKPGPRNYACLLVQASWVIWRGRQRGRRRVAHVGASARRAPRATDRDGRAWRGAWRASSMRSGAIGATISGRADAGRSG